MGIPVGFAQVNLKYSGTPVPTGAEVTFGVDLQVATPTPAGVATLVQAAWNTHLKARQLVAVVLASILVKFGPNDVGPSAEVAYGVAGTLDRTATQPNTALLVRKNTLLGGHGGQGRMFVPGVADNDVSVAGVLDATELAAQQTAWANFRTALDTADIPMVLLHNPRKDPEDPEGPLLPALEPTEVTSLSVQSIVATQRRRMRR